MNNIKISWELNCTELDSIEINDLEIVTEQILYSVCRQLRELEEIHKRTGLMIVSLQHVQAWVRGLE